MDKFKSFLNSWHENVEAVKRMDDPIKLERGGYFDVYKLFHNGKIYIDIEGIGEHSHLELVSLELNTEELKQIRDRIDKVIQWSKTDE